MRTDPATVVRPRLAARAERLVSSAIRDLLHLAERPDVLSLAGGLPDGSTFPVERVAAATERALRSLGRYGSPSLQYGATEGLAEFRDWAAHGSVVHPSFAMPEHVLVTTGSQQGLDLLARTLVDAGEVAIVEDPVYLGARQVLLAAGARLVGVPVDRNGLDVDVLATKLRSGLRPRLVYTVPHFQNPTGAVLSSDRRIRLAGLAEQYGFVVVEDDPYVALSFDGARLESLGALAPDHVVTLASASKVLSPGIRVGWLRAPAWLRRTLVLAKQAVDLHTATLNQLVALDVLSDDTFMRAHLETLRSTYATRGAALHDALAGLFETEAPRGGMFLWGEAERDTTEAFDAAIAEGVAYVPGVAFGVDLDRTRAVRLAYATLEVDALRDAATRLRRVFSA
jgi:2-aminoadipate transaminase